MLDSQGGHMGVGDEIRRAVGRCQQRAEDVHMSFGGPGDPNGATGQPVEYLLPRGCGRERALEGSGVGGNPQEPQEAWPGEADAGGAV
jgi:hypothetical protein